MDNHLLVFVTVAKHEHFSRAAEELHMTQSAVSLDIKSLEKRYGVKLFERTNKYVRLTPAGKIVEYYAKDILAQYQRLERMIDDLKHTASGPLFVGASYTFGEYILPHIVAGFSVQCPQVTPAIFIHNTKQITGMVLRHELDLGIVEGEVDHPQLGVYPFTTDELVVIVPANSTWQGRTEVSPEELAGERWIVREKGSGTRDYADHMFSLTGIQPENIMQFGSSQVIKESVEAGLGISFLSETVIRKELALGTLQALRIKDVPIHRNFSYVIHDSQFQTKACELFLNYLKSIYSK
jgi:LysR family transcriptional regulator, transcriptional activator of the cysJI operon